VEGDRGRARLDATVSPAIDKTSAAGDFALRATGLERLADRAGPLFPAHGSCREVEEPFARAEEYQTRCPHIAEPDHRRADHWPCAPCGGNSREEL